MLLKKKKKKKKQEKQTYIFVWIAVYNFVFTNMLSLLKNISNCVKGITSIATVDQNSTMIQLLTFFLLGLKTNEPP